jgi:hypothetical protein
MERALNMNIPETEECAVTRDLRECSVVELLQKMSDQRDVEAMITLGLYYAYGIGVEKSKHKAAELFERAFLGIEDHGLKWRLTSIAKNITRKIILETDAFPALRGAIKEYEKLQASDDLLAGALNL